MEGHDMQLHKDKDKYTEEEIIIYTDELQDSPVKLQIDKRADKLLYSRTFGQSVKIIVEQKNKQMYQKKTKTFNNIHIKQRLHGGHINL